MTSAGLPTTPLELQIRIFSYACTDSGQTGCALSCVCKDIRQLCRATGIDIQCAGLSGLRQLRGFLQTLTSREGGTRRVESLYLTWRPGERLEDADQNQNKDIGKESLTLMMDILKTISPIHLRILAINYASPRLPMTYRLIPYEFPSLVEFSVNGLFYDKSFELSSPAPNLKRLHILHYAGLPRDIGEHLTRLFPKLTHFRISSATQTTQDHRLPRFLYAYCRSQSKSSTGIISTPATAPNEDPALTAFNRAVLSLPATVHPTLRRVIIGLSPMIFIPVGPHFEFLRKIAQEQQGFGVREIESVDEGGIENDKTLLILMPSTTATSDGYFKAQGAMIVQLGKEWAERTTGEGKGCWISGVGQKSILHMDSTTLL